MKPFYQDKTVELHQADVLAWALDYKQKIDSGKALPFHSIISDPPYGLGTPPPIDELLRAWLDNEDYNTGSGFMSANWDCVVHPKVWRALLNVCFPGAYLFAFSGTRTADLLGISCRLGGWEPFDRIMHWTYGSGFPKSHNLSVALDKEAGAEREVVGWKVEPDGRIMGQEPQASARVCNPADKSDRKFGADNRTLAERKVVTAPATPLAQAFDGYGTSLKPAGEPILLFRKPREGRTFAQCARRDGSGGLDIGSCRVGISPGDQKGEGGRLAGQPNSKKYDGWGMTITGNTSDGKGRWPPNVAFSHIQGSICPTCHGSGFIESPPFTESFESWYTKTKDYGGTRQEWQRLCEPGGTSGCDECHGGGVVGGCRRVGNKRVRGSSQSFDRKTPGGLRGDTKIYGTGAGIMRTEGYADADGLEQVADFSCVEGCPILALDEMAGERPGSHDQIVNPREYKGMYGSTYKGKGYNDTGNASRFYPNHDWSHEIAERLAGETPFKYQAKASRGEREAGCKERPRKFLATMGDGIGEREHNEDEASAWVGNSHPTVKPISLAKWLASLCCPPPQFSPRLCIPFSGSGSEIIGAILSDGWAEIHGIERELEYCEIAAARIAWWTKWAKLTGKTDPAEIRKLGEAAEAREQWQNDKRQTSMFEMIERGLE